MFSTKITLKDEWFNIGAGILKNSEISTETLYASTEDELNKKKDEYIKSRVGVSISNGIKHSTMLIENRLTKEEMFDFIIENEVNCTVSNSTWSDNNGKIHKIKYKVQINNIDFGGFDLEEAIQYYNINYKGK